MENSINTNESSGIDINEKKQAIKNEEKEENKENYGKEKEEKNQNEENNNEKKQEEEILNIIKDDSDIKDENNDEKEIKKEENENKKNLNLDDNSNKNDIKDDNDNLNDIQYSHSLLEEVGKYTIKKLPDNYDKEDANFKVLFLGDSGVGKSSLVFRAIRQQYDSFYKPTVGFDLLNYIVKINDKVMKLQLWDTCGQEEFSMCNQSLFKNATIAIMVYSITNKNSFDNIKKWVSRVKNLSKEDAIFFLVGNKSDLCNQRQVNFTEAKKYGNDKFEFFVETSSKYGYNVDILFKEIVIYLYEKFLVSNSIDEKEESKIEEYISDEQTSSFLSSETFGNHSSKKCLKCC